MSDLFQRIDINAGDNLEVSTKERLHNIVTRIDNLEQEKQELQSDIKDILTEAANDGFDVKIIRKIIKIMKMHRQDIEQEQGLIQTYMNALEEYRQHINFEQDAS